MPVSSRRGSTNPIASISLAGRRGCGRFLDGCLENHGLGGDYLAATVRLRVRGARMLTARHLLSTSVLIEPEGLQAELTTTWRTP